MGKVTDYVNDKKFNNPSSGYCGVKVEVDNIEALRKIFRVQSGIHNPRYYHLTSILPNLTKWLDSSGGWNVITFDGYEPRATFRFARPETAVQFKLTYL